jgi:hypothetical protein
MDVKVAAHEFMIDAGYEQHMKSKQNIGKSSAGTH